MKEVIVKAIDPHIEIMSAPDRDFVYEIIGRAAANCYQSSPKSYENLVRKIASNGHHSVLEHIQVTFKLTCDRAVSHELVRHRVGTAYSQESQRYCAYRDHLVAVKPQWLKTKGEHEAYHWLESVKQAYRNYLYLIEIGLKPEDARGVLPNAAATKVVVTMNLRALLHFIELRGSMKAHPDIRFFAHELERYFGDLYPAIFNNNKGEK